MIILILLLGFILRAINLNQSLWLDEATQVLLSQKSLYSIFYERAVDFHPPLSYILMHFWVMVGTSESLLRMFSVVLGVITIYILYFLTKDLFGRPVALLAALLLTISPYHIYYSQEIRMYSLTTLLAALSMFFLIRSLKGHHRLNWLGYILSTSALIWTLYTGVFLIFTQLLYVVFFERDKLKQFIASLILVFISYIPWLPQFFKQLEGGTNIDEYLPGWREVLGLDLIKSIPLTIFKFTAGRIDFDNNYLYACLIFLTLTLVGYCIFKSLSGKRTKEIMLIALWFCVPLLLSLIVSIKIPLNQPFRLLFVIPAFYILIAYGISKTVRWSKMLLAGFVIFSVLGLSLYFTQPRFQREDWRGAVNYINNNVGDGMVLFVWPEPLPPYIWYKGSSKIISVADSFPAEYELVEMKLTNANLTNKVMMLDYLQDLSDPERYTKQWLVKNHYIEVSVNDFPGVGFVRQYQR